MFPLVSIIVPTCNGARYILSALQSAIKQTYRPIEIVVSDDASSDGTVALIQRAVKTADVSCRIFAHKPEGMVENWNFCVCQAKGEFIKFLFQDDILEPECVEKMMGVVQERPSVGMVFCQRNLLGEEDYLPLDFVVDPLFKPGRQHIHTHWKHLDRYQTGLSLLGDPHLFHSYYNNVGEPSCVMLRRDVFDRVGFFDVSYCQAVDIEFWLRVMLCYDVGFVNQALAGFRVHSTQQTFKNEISGKAREDWDRFFHWVYTGPVRAYLHPKVRFMIERRCSMKGLLRETEKSVMCKVFDLLRRLRLRCGL